MAAPRVAVLGMADLSRPPLRVELLECRRSGAEILTVLLRVTSRDRAAGVTLGATFAASPSDAGSLADVWLVDEAREKKYCVLRDDQGRPSCSQGLGVFAPGDRRTVWARFPGPPAGVTRITVQVPGIAAFRNVPISASPGRP